MTSVIRSFALGRSLPATAQFVMANFTNSSGYDQPFPWRFNNRTEAIDLDFVDGFTVSTSLNDDDMFFRGQNFGGISLVQRLGPNFVAWCEDGSGAISADVGTVKLYEAPIVVNANMVAPGMTPNIAASQESTDPISFESAAGSAEGQYCKTLIFMKPMVISYKRSGTQYYRWFNQNFEGNT